MKKLYLLALLCCVASISLAQDRVNKPKVEFDMTSSAITNVVGWSYHNNTGQWISNTNFISDNISLRDANFTKEYKMAKGSQNFKNMQFKSFLLDGIRYYVLIFDNYRHNPLDEIRPIATTSYTAFTESEYEKLLNIRDYKNLRLESEASFDGVSQSDDSVVSTLIMLLNREGRRLKYYFKLELTESENKPVVRFILPMNQFNIDKFDFKNNYFEISETEFTKLFLSIH